MDSLLNGHDNEPDSLSSSSLDNLKPSVLVISFILLMTLLIFVFICILLCLLSRCSHHRQSISHSSSDSRRLTGCRVSLELASPSVLDSLPVFKFYAMTHQSSSAISSDCAVCLSKFELHDLLRLLPPCCHAFHADCIDTWPVSNQTCPLCRSPLFTADSNLTKALSGGGSSGGENSFRLEIGSISRRHRQTAPESGDQQRSYSIGSFDYIIEDNKSKVSVNDICRRSDSGSSHRTEELPRPHPSSSYRQPWRRRRRRRSHVICHIIM